MDLIRDYEFDALSYIDREYDNPVVQDAVHALITAEMKTFVPPVASYLAHLPYPALKFSNSPALKAEYKRVSNGLPAESLDLKRYSVEKPEPGLEKDVQAWKSAVANAKAQYQHQLNRSLNLELAEAHVGPVWLHHNKTVEGLTAGLRTTTEQMLERTNQVNSERKRLQEASRVDLDRMQKHRDEALYKCWQMQAACRQLEEQLPPEVAASLYSNSIGGDSGGGSVAEGLGSSDGDDSKRMRID